MSISGISPTPSLGQVSGTTNTTQKPTNIDVSVKHPSTPEFSERIMGAVDKLAQAQKSASDSAVQYEMGKTDDLAAVMVEQQVASLGFQLTMQVRNKALTAYKDIMNMPV